MKNTAAEIEAALANYCKVAAERNKRVLEGIVDAITTAEFADEYIREETGDEEWREEQLVVLSELVEGDLKELGLSAPKDLLDRFDDLAARLRLDGTSEGHLDPEERAARAAVYFDALDAALKQKAPEEVRGIISVPGEFRVLARHVLQINGPMLPDSMGKYAMSFWQDEGMYEPSKIPDRVMKSDEAPYPYNMYKNAALVWDSGTVINGQFCCAYVQEEDGSWNWNFVWQWEGGGLAFDNIPELFEWYLQRQDNPPDFKGLTAEAILSREF